MPRRWHSVSTHPPGLQKSVCKLLKTKKRRRENLAKRGQRGGKSKKIGELQVGNAGNFEDREQEGTHTPPSKCVNTLDKGLAGEMYGNATNKGVTGEPKQGQGAEGARLTGIRGAGVDG
jgi:hypothetical protein